MGAMQASMLIPIGVVLYTAAGGLKATFMASYVHTAIVYIALLIFTFLIYASSEENIGSPAKVWEALKIASDNYPVEDNRGGSYLTMLSKSGFIFGVINIVGNFGTVFVDQVTVLLLTLYLCLLCRKNIPLFC